MFLQDSYDAYVRDAARSPARQSKAHARPQDFVWLSSWHI
jgi:hypothetical protein